jgi:hypothetical protein
MAKSEGRIPEGRKKAKPGNIERPTPNVQLRSDERDARDERDAKLNRRGAKAAEKSWKTERFGDRKNGKKDRGVRDKSRDGGRAAGKAKNRDVGDGIADVMRPAAGAGLDISRSL